MTAKKVVVLVGAGALGSRKAIALARAFRVAELGEIAMHVIDPDIVTASTLASSEYEGPDEGHLKSDRLVEKIRSINPVLAAYSYPRRVEEVGPGIFTDAIVLLCLDNPGGRFFAARAAWNAGARVIFSANVQGGDSQAARYQVFVPGSSRSACVECNAVSAEFALASTGLSFSCTTPRRRSEGTPSVPLAAGMSVVAAMLPDVLAVLAGSIPDHSYEQRILDSGVQRRLVLRPNPACLFDHAVFELHTVCADSLSNIGAAFALAGNLAGEPVECLVRNQPVVIQEQCLGGHHLPWPSIQRIDAHRAALSCPTCGQGIRADVSFVIPGVVGRANPTPLTDVTVDRDILSFRLASGRMFYLTLRSEE